jgi:mannose-1-phosphate guanylyltransferase
MRPSSSLTIGARLPGIFFPAHWVYSAHPDAVAAVFPSDHLPRGRRVHASYRESGQFVRKQPERILLIGAQADTAETEYGWIQPGEPLGQVGATPILRVTRFWEKTSEVQAKA